MASRERGDHNGNHASAVALRPVSARADALPRAPTRRNPRLIGAVLAPPGRLEPAYGSEATMAARAAP
jgi:hypothetical protein